MKLSLDFDAAFGLGLVQGPHHLVDVLRADRVGVRPSHDLTFPPPLIRHDSQMSVATLRLAAADGFSTSAIFTAVYVAARYETPAPRTSAGSAVVSAVLPAVLH